MTTLAANSIDWIADACRRFSESTGWTLRFAPAGVTEWISGNADSDPCWSAEIGDGQHTIGQLRLDLPDDARRDSAFGSVSTLAEAFGQLISRTVAAGRLADTRGEQLSTLVELNRKSPAQEDFVAALDRLLKGAIQLTSFRTAAFFLLDASADRLQLRATAQREPLTISMPVRELAANPPDLAALAQSRLIISGSQPAVAEWLPAGTLTAVCQAVESETGPIGTLWVFDRRKRDPDSREIHVIESIAAQIAALLERVVLLRESAAQHRIQRDLEIASQSQMFDVETKLSEGAAVDAALRSTSHCEIGGDLCELIPIDNRRTAFAIGDASGHGISAALVMSAVRGALHVIAGGPSPELRPERILERINRALYGITPPHQFMSMLVGVYDSKAGTIAYSNAGHPSPLVRQGDQIVALESHGMLLGVLSDTSYCASTLRVKAGDLFVAFTDGVSEAMNNKRKMFRSNGISDTLRLSSASSPRGVLDAVWSQLEHHLDGGQGHDDRSMMVIRIH